MKKRAGGSVTLDEVFARAEKSPAWKAAYATLSRIAEALHRDLVIQLR